MPKLKLVTFDLMGSLLRPCLSVGHVYAHFGQCIGVCAEAEVLEANFKTQFKALSKERPNFGKNDCGWQKWWEDLIRKTYDIPEDSVDKCKMDSLVNNLLGYYGSHEAYCFADAAAWDVLSYLKKEGFVVGAITNSDPRIHSILCPWEDLKKYFDFITVSYDVGVAKPDVEIFEEAEDKYLSIREKSPPKKLSLHVGSSPSQDYMGAVCAGWHGALISEDVDKITCKYPDIESHMIFCNMAKFLEFLKEYDTW